MKIKRDTSATEVTTGKSSSPGPHKAPQLRVLMLERGTATYVDVKKMEILSIWVGQKVVRNLDFLNVLCIDSLTCRHTHWTPANK